MRKQLKAIINKLNKRPISSLTGDEFDVYFEHRMDNLICDKKVLTKNELVYLLSETGPGNRRIDPRLVLKLVDQNILVSSILGALPEMTKLKGQKEKVDKYILDHKSSKETKQSIIKLIGSYLKNVKMISDDPFIIEATFKNMPISCLIKNGGWIFPDSELFSFLSAVQKQKRFPIVIAKKISGILFPVFKGLSILGLNLYKTLLPEEGEKLITSSIYKPKESFLSELKYNGQFQFLTREYVENIQDEYWNGDPLKNFFENVLLGNISTYYENFSNLKINITDNFADTVSQFRKNKTTKNLLEMYKTQEKIISAK
ncbi:MAG: hypothetical protein PHW53_03970 [Patescibacteria group bacterium]|nr:hypothetical protein [Patescibacteria group bacterium]